MRKPSPPPPPNPRDPRFRRPQHIKNLPIVAQLVVTHRWKVRMSDDPHPVFSFECGARLKHPKVFAAEYVRERFFNVKTPADALIFFKEFGPWNTH